MVDINELAEELTARWINICIRRGVRPRAPSATELATLRVLVDAILAGPPGEGNNVRLTRYGRDGRTSQILNTIQNLDGQMDMYERMDLLDQALENIPLQDIHERAEQLQASKEPLPCFEDALADVLVKWFRDDYFVWADRKTEKCPVCEGPMQFDSSPEPTVEERRGGAGRVELHKCKKVGCTGQFRFPRYNDPSVLMKTRVGRCGEFANLFMLFLRAMGLRAQYVWNLEDHVWNAYYSPAQSRWIHLDSCEAARDQPLLYSKGWGKKMSFILAFSTEGAIDVSRGYIQSEKWEEAKKTRDSIISEAELRQALAAVTRRRRTGLPADILKRLEEEDVKMRAWLDDPEGNRGDTKHLEPRQSGTEEWKQERGEAGPSQ